MTVDQCYRTAAQLTGRTESDLRATGESVFASMLFHAMLEGKPIWTLLSLNGGKLDVEVRAHKRNDDPIIEGVKLAGGVQ